MENRLILSDYRIKKAHETLCDARILLKEGSAEASANRSYYAIFHGIRAVTALDGFDSSKHSGVISYFNQNYVKPGIFDRELSKIIKSAMNTREKADYDDFSEVSYEQAETQIAAAEKFLGAVSEYLQRRIREF